MPLAQAMTGDFFEMIRPYRGDEYGEFNALFDHGMALSDSCWHILQDVLAKRIINEGHSTALELIHSILLRRCHDDLIWAFDMCSRAYYVQAWTLVRSALESTYVDKALTSDNTLIPVWLQSEDEVVRKTFTTANLRKLGGDPSFKVYSLLSGWGTHPRSSMITWSLCFNVKDQKAGIPFAAFERVRALLAFSFCLLVLSRYLNQVAADYQDVYSAEIKDKVAGFAQKSTIAVEKWHADWSKSLIGEPSTFQFSIECFKLFGMTFIDAIVDSEEGKKAFSSVDMGDIQS